MRSDRAAIEASHFDPNQISRLEAKLVVFSAITMHVLLGASILGIAEIISPFFVDIGERFGAGGF